MPHSAFYDPKLLSNGDLQVGGPFDPEGAELVGAVTIRFLLVQEPQRAGDPDVIVDDVASWSGERASDWGTTIPAAAVPPELRPDVDLRAIGTAVVVRRVPGEEIPAVDTLTWCVTRKVTRAGESAY